MRPSTSPATPVAPQWPGYAPHGTLVLPLPACWLEGRPALLEVDGVLLERKHEAHLTLLDRVAAALVREACVEEVVRAQFQAHDWRVVPGAEHWLLRRTLGPGRVAHSVIEIVHAPGLAAFRSSLGARCGVQLPEAPPHVTLYVAGKPTGIGVPDRETFERLRVRRLDAANDLQAP